MAKSFDEIRIPDMGDTSPPEDSIHADHGFPMIPLDLREHKTSIAINWIILFIATCVLPELLYFVLRYATTVSTKTIFDIVIAVIGLPALISYLIRTYRLIRHDRYRPLGCRNWWTFDYFHLNFLVGIAYSATVLAVGNADDKPNLRLISLALPLVMLQLSGQFVLIRILGLCGAKTPFRFSSYPRGILLPSGAAVVAEDICAVDGNQGREFRAAWHARIEASVPVRQALNLVDWVWGVSGTLVAGGIIAVIYTVDNADVGYALSWSVPWVWGAMMTLFTFRVAHQALEKEQRHDTAL